MSKQVSYTIVDSISLKVAQKSTAEQVGSYMLGRQVSLYYVIKHDGNGPRLVSLTKPDGQPIFFCSDIVKQLEVA